MNASSQTDLKQGCPTLKISMYSSGNPKTYSKTQSLLPNGKLKNVSGWASQWYPSPFTVNIEGFEDVTFATAEHWMMFQKAIIFNDTEIAREIARHTGTTPAALARIKALGRRVDNFDEHEWKAERGRVVLEGSLHKFRQNEKLREKLLGTGEARLVEASPRDRIWGVGYGAKNAYGKRDNWGLNLPGKALEEAREILCAEESDRE